MATGSPALAAFHLPVDVLQEVAAGVERAQQHVATIFDDFLQPRPEPKANRVAQRSGSSVVSPTNVAAAADPPTSSPARRCVCRRS